MTRRRRWLTLGLLGSAGILLGALAPPAADGQAHAFEDFTGRYAFAGGQNERDRQHAAIDGVVDQLNVFIREIARGEIRRNLQPEGRVSITTMGETRMRVGIGDWAPPEIGLDGSTRRVTGPDGSATQLSARFRGGRIETFQRNHQGSRENWLSLSPDGRFLYMQVRIAADQLPAAIRYTLSYRRR